MVIMDICPICKNTEGCSQWINCDACKVWFHIICLKLKSVEEIEKFHCPSCIATNGPTTYKNKIKRRSNRSSARLNYADLNEGKSTGDERIWGKLLGVKNFKKDKFKRYEAKQVNLDLLRSTGFREPFLVEKNEPELGMAMPPRDITVKDIARLVGGDDYPVEVIDVASQSEIAGWTMGRWAEYFHNPERDRIRNVISLEISGSDLSDLITRPKIVREMDWIDQMWPAEKHPEEFPRVQLYCLMGTKDSYTDFHIDFGGSSVFYHVLSGSKRFYFIEPTPKNLKKYQKWSSSPDQSITFLGDEVKECYSVEINAGNTMFIPAGWIHAVYTPEDAIVIGGNFLQSFNIETQIQVYWIEQATEVPMKFRFPYYKRLNWYALAKFDKWLSSPSDQQPWCYQELESMAVLATFLYTDILENEKSKKKLNKTISQQARKQLDIPDTINDPLALVKRVISLVKTKLRQEVDSNKTKALDDTPKPTEQKILIRVKTSLIKKELKEKDNDYIEEDPDDNEDNEERCSENSSDEEYESENEMTSVNQKKKIEKKDGGTKRPISKTDLSSVDNNVKTMETINKVSVKRKKTLSSPLPQKSVKQRLLDRIHNNKKH